MAHDREIMQRSMDGRDRRVKRTQRRLAEALIALTLEQGYEAVTIRDITERADVGYATFFRHYPDKEALLQDVLDVVLDELLDLIQPVNASLAPEEVGILLFRYVQQNSELCRVLLSSRGSTSLLQRMIDAGTSSLLAQRTPLAGSPVPPEVAAHHIVVSSIALIQWWLEHAMPYSVERMAQVYHRLIVHPTETLAFERGKDKF